MPERLPPPYTQLPAAGGALADAGFVVLEPGSVRALARVEEADLASLREAWADLPPDQHLRDGGRYRRRRHASCVVAGAEVSDVPHRAHWQPEEYNALHGGIERWFEPVPEEWLASRAWRRLVTGLGALFSEVRPGDAWFVEAHQFRIDTTDGIGRPTPEGAHRDGVDFVALLLVDVQGIKGGETRVFEAGGAKGLRFTLTEPWSALLIDDARVVHETTPIQPLADFGHRDTLVLTFRRGGFQRAEG